jgi:nucleoid-associated protein YgaU
LTIDIAGRYNKQTEANARTRWMDSLGTDFNALLTCAATVALVCALAWALVVSAAVAVEAGTGGHVRIAESVGCPPVVRLWLLGVFVALFAAVTPAHASDSGPGNGPAGRAAAALDGLPLPDRAIGAARPSDTQIVVVRPGDSLWRIARELLPTHASNPTIAAAVHALHGHNRRVIGPDPDVLLPGQRLELPPDFPDPTTLPEEP